MRGPNVNAGVHAPRCHSARYAAICVTVVRTPSCNHGCIDARYAAGLLVTTAAAKETVSQALGGAARDDIMTLAQPLPCPGSLIPPPRPTQLWTG